MLHRRRRAAFAALFILAACGTNDATPSASDAGSDAGATDGATTTDATDADGASDAGGDAGNYLDPNMWICGAGTPHDYCLDPQTVTTIAPDGSKTTSMITAATNPKVDCFYIYPTVDASSPAGNRKDFSNLPAILDPVHSQALPFSQVCKLYVPLYHQATLASYQNVNANTYLENAYADVAAAFRAYMTTFNQGRDFILIGHSQGSHMLRRLIQREVESTPATSAHLLLAFLAGPLGDTVVPKGQVVGGSFKSTPLCTSDTQRGCIYSWSSFAKGYEPTSTYGVQFNIPAGMDIACSVPGVPNGGKGMFSGALFWTKFNQATLAPPQNSGVSTAYADYPSFFSGQCLPAAAANGLSFLEIDAAPGVGDTRTNPIPFDNAFFYSPTVVGLHLIDWSFPMQDALDAVTTRVSGGGTTDAGADAADAQ
jgi:hypothetical protein